MYRRLVTSFHASAAHVRNGQLTPARRLFKLRECVNNFAPYGFRATWHHLVNSAAIPRRLNNEAVSLIRAVEELEEARAIWLAYLTSFETRRQVEKSTGQRSSASWRFGNPGGIHRIAACPNPAKHPTDRLKVVVERLVEVYASGADWAHGCPVCGHRRRRQPCGGCGVVLRGHLALASSDAMVAAPQPLALSE